MESKIVGMYLGKGVIGCSPQPVKSKLVPTGQLRGRIAHEVRLEGDEQFPVYSDREVISGWEALELTKHDEGFFSARFVDSNRQLTINPLTGGLETRGAGIIQAWQQFNVAKADDGTILLWLINAPNCILRVEEV